MAHFFVAYKTPEGVWRVATVTDTEQEARDKVPNVIRKHNCTHVAVMFHPDEGECRLVVAYGDHSDGSTQVFVSKRKTDLKIGKPPESTP